MRPPLSRWLFAWFCLATLISAFLVFQVQPVISKAVLPWFGGSPSVWTTCMLFFQVLLFGGYAYAHLTTHWLSRRWQGIVHFGLIATALLVLPITPAASWKPDGQEHPTLYILLILAANVGLPYFLLASTGPLIQAWFSDATGGRSPYRLYALSNLGSLVALLSYPFLFEPALSTLSQGRVWSLGFCLFALLCGYLASRLWCGESSENAAESQPTAVRPAAGQILRWLVMPAFASVMLLATTNHVCQDVAVIPFLWVAPLSLYLLTFIICFDHEKWYSRRWCGGLAIVSVMLLTVLIQWNRDLQLLPEVVGYLGVLFLVCMVCHGELVRSKPVPRFLTGFYLTASAGGALGGITVAVLCPLVFTSHLEMNLCVVIGAALSMCVFLMDARETWWGDTPQRRWIGAAAYFAVFLFVGVAQFDRMALPAAASVRNFYGVLHVESHERGTTLVHGRTIHGFQFQDASLSRLPTSYYAPESGVGRTLMRAGKNGPLRVGVVGLGSGTLATYGRAGDTYRFYEINPAVVDFAQQYFTYLENCRAEYEVVIGDARLSLENEPDQDFDVLVLDAFSSDSIPVHLLTREAFDVYDRHLNPNGVIAMHITNRHLRLEPVVLRLAEDRGMACVRIRNRGDRERGVKFAKWMMATRNRAFLDEAEIRATAMRFTKKSDGREFPLWTDQYNNLFQVLDVF